MVDRRAARRVGRCARGPLPASARGERRDRRRCRHERKALEERLAQFAANPAVQEVLAEAAARRRPRRHDSPRLRPCASRLRPAHPRVRHPVERAAGELGSCDCADAPVCRRRCCQTGVEDRPHAAGGVDRGRRSSSGVPARRARRCPQRRVAARGPERRAGWCGSRRRFIRAAAHQPAAHIVVLRTRRRRLGDRTRDARSNAGASAAAH